MKKTTYRNILLWYPIILCKSVCAITLSGPIAASTVTVSGEVTISSMTASTMTVINLLQVNGKPDGIKGIILQTLFSSTSSSFTTTSTTLTPITGMSVMIALSNPNNYLRISLSGVLATSDYTASAKVSIERDSIDLGQGAFSIAAGYPGAVATGITMTDSPGDTISHTYQATFDISASTQTATFTASPVSFLLVEEIAR